MSEFATMLHVRSGGAGRGAIWVTMSQPSLAEAMAEKYGAPV